MKIQNPLFIGKLLFTVFIGIFLASNSFAQKSNFTGKWEFWANKAESRGFVVELKEKRGLVTGTASGAIPHLYEADIKPAKIAGNSITANISDEWGNSGTVKITIRGKYLYWRVLKSNIKSNLTFPLKADLKRSK